MASAVDSQTDGVIFLLINTIFIVIFLLYPNVTRVHLYVYSLQLLPLPAWWDLYPGQFLLLPLCLSGWLHRQEVWRWWVFDITEVPRVWSSLENDDILYFCVKKKHNLQALNSGRTRESLQQTVGMTWIFHLMRHAKDMHFILLTLTKSPRISVFSISNQTHPVTSRADCNLTSVPLLVIQCHKAEVWGSNWCQASLSPSLVLASQLFKKYEKKCHQMGCKSRWTPYRYVRIKSSCTELINIWTHAAALTATDWLRQVNKGNRYLEI